MQQIEQEIQKEDNLENIRAEIKEYNEFTEKHRKHVSTNSRRKRDELFSSAFKIIHFSKEAAEARTEEGKEFPTRKKEKNNMKINSQKFNNSFSKWVSGVRSKTKDVVVIT